MLSKTNQALIEAHERGYRATDRGDVIGLRGYILKLKCTQSGYFSFTYRNNVIMAHKLVAYQKYGFKLFADGIEVRHLDGDKENNCIDNIAIGTHRDNVLDIPAEIRKRTSVRACQFAGRKLRKLSDSQVRLIRKLKADGLSYTQLDKMFDLAHSTIVYVCTRRTYKHVK